MREIGENEARLIPFFDEKVSITRPVLSPLFGRMSHNEARLLPVVWERMRDNDARLHPIVWENGP